MFDTKYKAVVCGNIIAESTSIDGAIFALWNIGGYEFGYVWCGNERWTIRYGEIVYHKKEVI